MPRMVYLTISSPWEVAKRPIGGKPPRPRFGEGLPGRRSLRVPRDREFKSARRPGVLRHVSGSDRLGRVDHDGPGERSGE